MYIIGICRGDDMNISKYNTNLTLDYLVGSYEGSYFDRKNAKIDLKNLANIIASFANANGGLVAVGIDDDGVISGFEAIGEDKFNNFLKILSTSYFKVVPKCLIEVISVNNINNKEDKIILYHVDPSVNKVIRNSKDEVYLRQGDSSNKLDSNQIKILEYERNETVFEDEIVVKASLDDIDEDMVELYRKVLNTNMNTRELLKARKFILIKDGKEFLTNAGVLLFTKDPSLFLPSARVRVIRIDGTELKTGVNMNIVKDQTFALPLYKVIIKAQEFIKTQLRDFTHLGDDGKFVTVSEYPEFAWTEGLVNAVTHRDYSISGEYIKVFLYDDRLEIVSPGKLPGLITLDSMISERFARNPQISRVLTELGLVRELNEGVKRIYEEMKDFFLDDPEYSEPNGRSVKLILKNNIVMRDKRKAENLLKNTIVNDKWNELNELEKQIVSAIHDRGKMTTSELSELTSRDRKTVQRKLKKLQDLGIIKWIGTSIKDPQKVYMIK